MEIERRSLDEDCGVHVLNKLFMFGGILPVWQFLRVIV